MVDNSRKIVDGLSHTATVRDVLKKLVHSKQHPQVMLEIWKGCSRVLPMEEKISEWLAQWGNQAREVTLTMVNAFQPLALFPSRWGRKRKRKWTSVGKVARRKISAGRKHRKVSGVLLSHRLRRYRLQLEDLEADIHLQRVQGEEFAKRMVGNLTAQHLLPKLDLDLRTKYLSLKHKVEEEETAQAELLQHKTELQRSITSRKNEILALTNTAEELQNKVC